MKVNSIVGNKAVFGDPAREAEAAAKAKVEELKAKAGAVTLKDIMDMLLLIYEKLQVK